MSEQVPEEVFVLRVEEQVEGVARFLDAIGVVPEMLQALSAEINATPIGDIGAFHGKGAQLAQAVAAGYQASIRGALAGGLTPADFALQAVGGDDLRRALQGQADAAVQYARALQSINDATARARALGLPALASPAIAAGQPAFSGPNVSSRLEADQSRARRFEDRLEQIMTRLERRGVEPRIDFGSRGQISLGTERLADHVDLPSAREERALRKQAEQAAIDANRAILDVMQRRASLERGVSPTNVPYREDIEAALGARNTSTFLRGRELPSGAFRRLEPEVRQALFGSPEIVKGTRLSGPGFVTPEDEFARMLQERVSGNRAGFTAPLELQTAGAAAADAQLRLEAENARRQQEVARARAATSREELRELATRLSDARESAAGARRYRGVVPRPTPFPSTGDFDRALNAVRGLRAPEEMVEVFRGSREPVDLSRIGSEGIRVTRQRDYAEQYGGDQYLYRARVPISAFGDPSPFTGERLPHARLSREQYEAAGFEAIRRPEPPPLRRGGVSVEEQIARLTSAGVPLEQAQQMAATARQLAQPASEATTAVRRLAQAVDQLGAEASQSAAETARGGELVPTGRRRFFSGPLGVGFGDAGVGTDEIRGMIQRGISGLETVRALTGTIPREDIAAGRALRDRLLAGGGPLALTAGGGAGGLPTPLAGSFGGRFGGPFGPFGGAPPPPPPRQGPGSFDEVPFDFDDLGERAKARSRNRRFAREAFEDTDPTFEDATERERRRRQDERDRAFRRQATAERMAHEENRRFDDRNGGFFDGIRRSFGGPSGSFRQEFGQGLRGRDDNLGFQLGQTARFSVLYGVAYSALFQVAQALSAATQEAIAYEDALVALEVASGRSRADVSGLAETTSEIAARAGLAPSAGVNIAAQSIGLFGATNASRAVQDQTAEISARVAAQIARVTGATPDATITQLAGTARSLGLGVESLPDLQDQLTFIGRRTGRNIADLLPAISNVGTLGIGAGFTSEELAAIVGQVTSTTGQTPAAAAGSFRQVLSRADDPNFNARVSQMFGFDATGLSLRDIFAQVAGTNPNRQQINEFSLLFGRGASQQVAQIVTRDFGRIEGLASGAEQAAGTGIGEREFERVMGSIGNQIKLFGTNLLELGQDLIDTGIVDSLALFIRAANVAVQALDSLVDLFNLLPREMRSVGFAIGEIYLATRLLRNTSVGQSVASAFASQAATAADGTLIATRGADGTFSTRPQGRFSRLGSLAAAVGPTAALIGGGLTISAVQGSLAEQARGERDLRNAQRAFGDATDLDSIRRAAGSAREAARTARGQTGFNAAFLFDPSTRGDAEDRMAVANNLATEARRQAKELEELSRARVTPEAAFGGMDSVDSVSTGLKNLADRGFTASQRIEALNGAFDSLIEKSRRGSATVATIFQGQGEQFGAAIGRDATQALVGRNGLTGLLRLRAQAADPLQDAGALTRGLGSIGQLFVDPLDAVTGSGRRERDQIEGVLQGIGTTDLAKLARGSSRAALRALRSRGLDPESGTVNLEQGDVAAITEAVADNARSQLGPLLKDLPKGMRRQILRAYTGSVAAQIRGTLGDFSGDNLTPENTAAFLAGQLQESALAGQQRAIETGDPLLGAGTRLGSLRAARARVASALGGGDLTKDQREEIYRQLKAFDLEIQQAEDDAMAQRVSRANALAEVEKSNLGLDDTVGRRAVDLRTMRANLRRTRDPNERAQIQAQINEARAQQEQDRLSATAANDLASIDPRSVIARTRSQLQSARARLATLTPGSEAYGQASDQIAQLEAQVRQQRVDRANSEINAAVAGNDSGTARARAALAVARNNLDAQLEGTQAYYDALAALQEAKRALANAELAAAEQRQALEGDASDPLEAARDAVANARRRLAADRASGQGKDVIAADRNALINARLQEDQTEFSQNLGDVQVAEQLGNISHQQYLGYLRSERSRLADRLAGMKRTDDGYRQATEQLQQIDLAIKSATDSLDGLFNLGDIKVPTPFEVRRSLVGGAAAGANSDFTSQLIGALQSNSGGVSIAINGADVAKVRSILSEYLGPQATGRGKKRRGS